MLEKLLYRFTDRLPCRVIDGEQGEPYLERYYLFGLLGWTAYLHRFVDSDPDRGLHDHPWGRALSLVLSSGYDELRPQNGNFDEIVVRRLKPWRLNWLRGDDYHRVLLRDRQPAWTLFMHGPRIKGWGFMVDGSYRAMAEDAGDNRHAKWWHEVPKGREVRRRRAQGI